MQLEQFLRLVLPSTGLFSIRWMQGKEAKGITYLHSLEEVASESLKIDSKGYTVYYSTCSFKRASGKADADNVAQKKCFYLDVDVDPKGVKGFQTRKEAQTALVTFVKELDLPIPLVVSSGEGFHVYFILEEPISAAEWLPIAEALKNATRKRGFNVDVKITRDVARVLRAVGTHHRKTETPLIVKALKTQYEITTPEVMAEKLGAVVAVPTVDPLAALGELSPDLLAAFAPSTDLVQAVEYPDSDAEAVAEACAFIKAFRDTGFRGGNQYNEWFQAMGVVQYCVEGHAKCHEYSMADENYDPKYCQEKIDSWEGSGAATCESIADFGYCEGCQYRGQYTSPVRLGEKAAELIKLVEVAATPPTGPFWPKDFGWDDAERSMYYDSWTKEDGEWVRDRIHFCRTKFHVETRLWTSDNTWAFLIHRLKYVKQGKEIWDTFTMPTSYVARPTDVASACAAKEVYVTTKHGTNLLSELFKAYGDALRDMQREQKTYATMGWSSSDDELDRNDPLYPMHADGFIIGDTLVTESGTETILLSETIDHDWRKGFGTAGTAKGWARGVHDLYVKPNAIPYQFVVLTEFAAPLASLFCNGEFRGIALILSGISGWAKTTSCKMALSVWGNPNLLTLNGNPKAGVTSLSFMNSLSALRHISPLLDEVTKQHPTVLGELVYSIAMGMGRKRLGRDGKPLQPPSPWASFTKITSNNPLMRRLVEDENDSEGAGDAMQKRIFEVNLDRLPYDKDEMVNRDDPTVGTKIQKFLTSEYGTAGVVWMRWVLQNKDLVVETLDRNMEICKAKSADPSAERFHDYFEAAVMTAAELVSKSGLMFPDVAGVRTFIHLVREDMRSVRDDTKVPMLDAFSRYLGQNQGGLLITDKFPQGKGRPHTQEFPKKELHGELVGRIALKDHFAALAVGPMKDWCKTRSIEFARLLEELDKNGYIQHDPDALKANANKPEPMKTAVSRLDLSRGTGLINSRTQCLMMDFSRMANKAHLKEVHDSPAQEAI